ncbi:hypothetical protein NM688_g4654 [Phlebia brevispora]|uniref:Uncharacterized protein n=1 Tax=Phlebia brevispora TaxID=194682 RepID=A0ACC1T217_9APHY|nr:hypothetical protein NM688_g4654 [Phlebia brevispora]
MEVRIPANNVLISQALSDMSEKSRVLPTQTLIKLRPNERARGRLFTGAKFRTTIRAPRRLQRPAPDCASIKLPCHRLCCSCRPLSKCRAAGMPSNADPERRPLVSSEPHLTRTCSSSEIGTEGPFPSRISPPSVPSAESRQAGRPARALPEPEFWMEVRLSSETQSESIRDAQSRIEDVLDPESHIARISPKVEPVREGLSRVERETPPASLSDAESGIEASPHPNPTIPIILISPPSGSEEGWDCRYQRGAQSRIEDVLGPESHIARVSPKVEPVREGLSRLEREISPADPSDAESGIEASPHPKPTIPISPPSESEEGWECRYQAHEPGSHGIQWKDLQSLIDLNKREGEVQMDYWSYTFPSWDRKTPERIARITKPKRKVIVYSDETLREKAELDIPIQVNHTTTNPAIPSSLADRLCADLGMVELLNELNELLRTSYSLDTPGLSLVLEQCIERKYDVGVAFGRLRRFWFEAFEGLPVHLAELERDDDEARENALDGEKGLIVNKKIAPRRVWDLYSNRVLPVWALGGIRQWDDQVWAISHSWMAPERRQDIDTPINAHEWPVPIPEDVSLNRIRIELLNLGAEYAWLDVLCLRQEDKSKSEKEERLRVDEWKLDVPTIGSIYNQWVVEIVTYFEGLGRPFHISSIDSPRHWVNHAWTFQETRAVTFIGGLTPRSPFPPNDEDLSAEARRFYEAFIEMTHYFYSNGRIFHLIQIMLKRNASYEVDKIAGLAYLTGSDALPVYMRSVDADEAAQAEAAWTHLVHTMAFDTLIPLMFLYPAPGDGEYAWTPTWCQLKSKETPLPHATFAVPAAPRSQWVFNPHRLKEAHLLEPCTIQGLGEPDPQQQCRRGILTVEARNRENGLQIERFAVTAHHQHPIPDNQIYTLAGFRTWRAERDLQYWMVGSYTSSGALRKVSVLEIEDEAEWERLATRVIFGVLRYTVLSFAVTMLVRDYHLRSDKRKNKGMRELRRDAASNMIDIPSFPGPVRDGMARATGLAGERREGRALARIADWEAKAPVQLRGQGAKRRRRVLPVDVDVRVRAEETCHRRRTTRMIYAGFGPAAIYLATNQQRSVTRRLKTHIKVLIHIQ